MYNIKRGDVLEINLGRGMGSEQFGVRPCLVVSNDIGNDRAPIIAVLPLTSQTKRFKATHVEIDTLLKESTILCEQIRAVDKARVKKYICTLNKECMELVDKKLILSLGIKL